ncbi:MAG: helicase-exonuclease AddAB subunit AddA [Lachnospiraceae bacterium]|nr:helicase-exonuclease AddAB subunit AddA [Lachnospiraceae bacterium]
MNFTETQQRVIDERGKNLLISAAAGSGKTAVLVERIVKMVCDGEDPVDIDRLLVVTFTNAAAAQMRERISRALQERLLKDPANEHLQRQTTLLYNAQITTIDSFCLFVLRNQFHTIGLDPGFRIGEEGEMRLLRGDVLADVLEEAYAQADPAFLHAMEYFSTGNRDRAVETEIMTLYDFAMSTPFPERWLVGRKQDYCTSLSGGLLDLPWMAELLEHVRLLLAGCEEKLRTALKICEEPDGPYFYGELLERELEMVGKIADLCGHSDYDVLCAAFASVRFDRLPSKKDDTISPAKREAAKLLRSSVKDTLSDLKASFFAGSEAQICRQMEGCQAALTALIDLTISFKEAFDAAKREKNVLDFDDIEHFALQVLLQEEADPESAAQSNEQRSAGDFSHNYVPTETALAYRAAYHEILIDEYQDSNLVQEYLLSSISGEAEGRYNRFMVGDVKQSIYKFRLARPELFLEKYDEYGKGGEQALRIDLHQNFRSRVEVLDSVNSLFYRMMGKALGGIVYDEQAALHPGAVYPPADADTMSSASAANETASSAPAANETASSVRSPYRTELLLVQEGDGPEELSAREQEAYAVAAKIKEILRNLKVTDQETGTLRQASFRDIVILLRTLSGWDEVFKRVLEEEGIPVYVTSRTGYFAAGEVQELLHFLRVLDNPLQDIPLYGVLHAYLGGFSEEEIAMVRAVYPKRRYLYDALRACAGQILIQTVNADSTDAIPSSNAAGPSDAIPASLRQKAAAFLKKIDRYRALAVYTSVHELLQIILRESGYLSYVAARPEGGRMRANVEMLLVKAADYEKTGYFGLYHFLRYMEQLEKYEVDYGEAGMQDENADVVRIMSVHKSKGLQFPICFVSGLSRRFRGKEGDGTVLADVDAGLGVDYVDPALRVRTKSLRKQAVAVKRRRDDLAEELRILYVAMTRAEEKLILSGGVKDLGKTALSLLPLRRRREKLLSYDVLYGTTSLLSFVLSALSGSCCLNGLYEAGGVEVDSSAAEYGEEMGVSVTLTGWDHVVEEKIGETLYGEEAKRKLISAASGAAEKDGGLMTEVSHCFSYRYPHENLKNLYTKTTVSELKKAGMQEESDLSAHLFEERPVIPYLPKFIENDERVTGSMRGSAFHKVMELFSFQKLTIEVNQNSDAARALLQEQMEQMRQDGRLSQVYYEAVSIPKLTAFLTGGAAWRMAEADRAGKLYKEQPFVLGLPANRLKPEFPSEETVLIQGIIDVFFEEEDGFVVLDYKTDAVETAEELVKRYRVQLDYYSEALTRIFGGAKSVKERIIYSFKLGREITLLPQEAGPTSILL